VVRRVVIALLVDVPWHPPGVDAGAWRSALAEDVVDLLATLAEVEPAIAVGPSDRPLAEAIAWPGMPVYDLARRTVNAALAAAAADGYEQAVVLAADAADVPALTIGKLLRPLTTRPVAVAPAGPDGGLLGVAARLPAPDWLVEHDLDTGSAALLRQSAPAPADVASTPHWRRLRGPADLASLNPDVEGWDVTRALLGG
jgi:hypothetical protein